MSSSSSSSSSLSSSSTVLIRPRTVTTTECDIVGVITQKLSINKTDLQVTKSTTGLFIVQCTSELITLRICKELKVRHWIITTPTKEPHIIKPIDGGDIHYIGPGFVPANRINPSIEIPVFIRVEYCFLEEELKLIGGRKTCGEEIINHLDETLVSSYRNILSYFITL